MQETRFNIRSLLESPSNQFLSTAFHAIIGREFDAIGLMYYAQRLQRGLPRIVVLAELRNSPEGQANAARPVSPELDKLVVRYRRLRNLPLKNLRWSFMPTFDVYLPKESGFNWEHWANDTIAEHLKMRAEHAILQAAVPAAQPTTSVADADSVSWEARQSLHLFSRALHC
jgi:hypothetical protein